MGPTPVYEYPRPQLVLEENAAMEYLRWVRVLGTAFAVVSMVGLAGCGEEGAGEKAGKKLDKAGQEMGKSVDEIKKQLQGK